MTEVINIPKQPMDCPNLIGSVWVNGSGDESLIKSPLNGDIIGRFRASTP